MLAFVGIETSSEDQNFEVQQPTEVIFG